MAGFEFFWVCGYQLKHSVCESVSQVNHSDEKTTSNLKSHTKSLKGNVSPVQQYFFFSFNHQSFFNAKAWRIWGVKALTKFVTAWENSFEMIKSCNNLKVLLFFVFDCHLHSESCDKKWMSQADVTLHWLQQMEFNDCCPCYDFLFVWCCLVHLDLCSQCLSHAQHSLMQHWMWRHCSVVPLSHFFWFCTCVVAKWHFKWECHMRSCKCSDKWVQWSWARDMRMKNERHGEKVLPLLLVWLNKLCNKHVSLSIWFIWVLKNEVKDQCHWRKTDASVTPLQSLKKLFDSHWTATPSLSMLAKWGQSCQHNGWLE